MKKQQATGSRTWTGPALPVGPAYCQFCRWRLRGKEMHALRQAGYTYAEIAIRYGLFSGSARSIVMRSIQRYLKDMKDSGG